MKKLSYINIFILVFLIGVLTIKAYTLSSYSLISVGQYDVGNPEKTRYNIPTVVLNNHSPNSDAQIAVTLSKKTIFGYVNITRIQKWMKNINSHDFKFGNMSTATYRANVVFNATNDNRSIAGNYYLTSME